MPTPARLTPPPLLQVAGAVTDSSPVQATLRSYLEELALLADGWFRRVTLAWPYAGGHVEIVGEAGACAGGGGVGWLLLGALCVSPAKRL